MYVHMNTNNKRNAVYYRSHNNTLNAKTIQQGKHRRCRTSWPPKDGMDGHPKISATY